ncbi:AAA family ATPase [Methylobacterium sp. J-030]|nr:AAA family ATPase [Methylobacterium sp. J-030]MCJ2072965.1 AAA family ATPase [Methylobacterium sp. J-030]
MFRLFGYAGSGKTTLARHLAEGLDGDVLFAAYTGKAADVLRRKGCPGAGTLHSLLYHPVSTADGGVRFELNPDSLLSSARLLIVDECSMVDAALAQDILAFGRLVLVLGDPFQLPPVKGAGYFTEHKPDVLLTEVHRQARDNPIIALATQVRQNGALPTDPNDERAIVVTARDLDPAAVIAADQVLVGRNLTRTRFNTRLRELRGRRGSEPVVGDKLVCLANNRSKGLLNGGLWWVDELLTSDKPDFVRLRLRADVELSATAQEMDDEPDAEGETSAAAGVVDEIELPADCGENARRVQVQVQMHRAYLSGDDSAVNALEPKVRRRSDAFYYGHALTVHKAQGSQWNEVVLFDESHTFREHAARWLYTGLTRAAERITVVVEP